MNPGPFQAPSLEELAPLFPNYSIDAFIAQGGMGAVYLATQTSLERQVAIKILPREFGEDEEFRASFAAEAKAMAKLNHPNLIGVYDFGEADGMPYIVMEYVAGKSLHHSAYGIQIDPAEAARIVIATCRGLHHAHEHDILHRDVKPANILLDPSADPKLGDFGLAMASNEDNSDGLIYGTPGYAAPEVYAGKPDTRSDIFAAGAVLYELLTGAVPTENFAAPSTLVACDRRFDRVLAKALRPDLAQRHQSAAELANDLADILETPVAKLAVAPATRVTPSASPALASSKKGSGGLIVGIIAAALALAAGLFFLSTSGQDKGEDNVAKRAAEVEKAQKEAAVEKAKAEKKRARELAQKKRQEQEKQARRQAEQKAAQERKLAAEKKQQEEQRKQEEQARQAAAKTAEEPDDEEEKPTVSTFDFDTFFARGRGYCRDRSGRLVTQYDADLIKNIEALEREAKRLLRDNDELERDVERLRKDNLEDAIERLKTIGRLPNEISREIPESFAEISASEELVEAVLTSALNDQEKLDTKLESDLAPLLASYRTGVQKQVQQLREQNNNLDADTLAKEVGYIGNFPYFLRILRGENPPPPPSNAELVAGFWHRVDAKTRFHLKADGQASAIKPKMKGSWTVEGEEILIHWDGYSDKLKINPEEPNEAIIVSGIDGSSIPFTREEALAPSDGVDPNAPIIGNWIREEDPSKTYQIKDDGTITLNNGNASGTWQENLDGDYSVQWGNGLTLRLTPKGKRKISVNGGIFTLKRVE